jgi:hypothetical protein
MQTKKVLRIIFISIVVGSIIAIGIYAFIKLKFNEEVYHADLFSLVPSENDILFYSHDPQNLPDLFPSILFKDTSCFQMAKSVYTECQNDANISGGNEIILSFKDNDDLILYRSTPQKIREWEETRIENQEFLFAPQKELYKNTTILAYLTAENRFFCFAYYQGAFVGSFSKKMIYNVLNTSGAKETVRNSDSFNMLLKISGEKSLASCFFKKNNWFAFDISYNNGNYWLDGCLLPAYSPKELYETFNLISGGHELNPEIIPGTTSGIIYSNTNYDQLHVNEIKEDSLLLQHATGDVSLIYYTDSSSYVHKAICVELINQEDFLKELSSCILQNKDQDLYLKIINSEDNHPHKKEKIFQLHPFVHLTSCLGKIYDKNDWNIFTLYKGYLIIADSKESIENYLSQLKSGHTFDKNPLYKLYTDNKNTDAVVSVLLNGDEIYKRPTSRKEIIPEYFSNNDSCRNYETFIQFHKEDELIYYNAILVKN